MPSHTIATNTSHVLSVTASIIVSCDRSSNDTSMVGTNLINVLSIMWIILWMLLPVYQSNSIYIFIRVMMIVLVSPHYKLFLSSFKTNWSNRFGSITRNIYICHVLSTSMNANSLSSMKLICRSNMRELWRHICSWIVQIYTLLISSILVLMNWWLFPIYILLTWNLSKFLHILIIMYIIFWCIFVQDSLLMINLQRHMLFLRRRCSHTWSFLRRWVFIISFMSLLLVRWSCNASFLFSSRLFHLL